MGSIIVKYRKKKTPKESQNNKFANVVGSVWLSLFMDGNGKYKLSPSPPGTGLSRIQHLNMVIVNFEFEF